MKSVPTMTCAELRQYDARAIAGGIPGIVLMESAARGACDLLLAQKVTGPVGVVVGKGNNGGDGLVIARHLVDRGYRTHVELLVDPAAFVGDALLAYRAAAFVNVPFHSAWTDASMMRGRLASCEWIVDAILGTGSTGPARQPMSDAIRIINQAGKRVLAIDLPSGLDGDVGTAHEPTIHANLTATFVAMKKGFLSKEAPNYLGEVHVIPIGAGNPFVPTSTPPEISDRLA
jgi:NAD(P)H-hydrate epimerase